MVLTSIFRAGTKMIVNLGKVPDNQLNELIESIFEVARINHKTSGSSITTVKPSVHFQLTLTGGDPGLIFHFIKNEHSPVYDCFCEIRAYSDLPPFITLFESANSALKNHDQIFGWYGLLTVVPFAAHRRLQSPYQITPDLRLEPSGLVAVVDAKYRSNSNQSLLRGDYAKNCQQESQIRYGVEVRVIGSIGGRTSKLVSPKAHRILHLISTVISVIFDAEVQLGRSPLPKLTSESEEKLDTFELSRPTEIDSFEPVVIPPQLASHWSWIESTSWITNAFGMFAQATSIQAKHPSLALLAFVSAIETVGFALFPATECPGIAGQSSTEHCSACMRKTGAAKAFRNALKLIRTKAEVKSLSSRIYSSRSLTTHTGKLHGLETLLGMPTFQIGLEDQPEYFFNEVWKIRNASRDLLMYCLEHPPVSIT